MIEWQINHETIISDLLMVNRIHTGELWLTDGQALDISHDMLMMRWTEQNRMIYDSEDYPMAIRVDWFNDGRTHITILKTGIGNNKYIIDPENPKEIIRDISGAVSS